MRILAPPMADPDDLNSSILGALGRFCAKPPMPTRAILRRLTAFVERWLNEFIVPLHPSEILEFEPWLETTTYTEARKDELRRAHLLAQHLPPHRGECVKLKGFVKRETYMEYKKSRMINSRSDAFKCWSGPLMKSVERRLFELPDFIKHIAVKDRPEYLLSRLGVLKGPYYMSDFSHFESHFVAMVQKAMESQLYEHVLKNDKRGPIFAKVLRGMNQIAYKKFSLLIRATRMSGEMSTSLANGFSNLMLWQFLAHEKGGRAVGVVEGDDGLFSCEGFVPTKEDFALMGFDVKLEQHTSLFTTAFCGMVFSEEMTTMTDPFKVLLNFGWSHSAQAGPSLRVRRELLKAKAVSLLYEHPRCPILSELAYKTLKKLSSYRLRVDSGWYDQQIEKEAVKFLGWAYEEHSRGVPDSARALFSQLYGITPDLQANIEQELGDLDSLPDVVQDLFLDRKDIIDFSIKYRFEFCPKPDVLARTVNIRIWVEARSNDRTKTVASCLNISVLTRMPRDCKAPDSLQCTVRLCLTYPIQSNMNPKKNILDKLVERGKITPDGAQWITTALDPFHDYQHQIAGYPDADGSATVVQCFQYAHDISKPAGSAGNWDCHIFTNPYHCEAQDNRFYTDSSEGTAGSSMVDLGPLFTLGGLVSSISCDSGEQLYPVPTSAFAPANGTYRSYAASGDIIRPDSRVIGFGFEVINTTAELSKQGSCTVYRMPQNPVSKCIPTLDSTGSYFAMLHGRALRCLPSTPALATKLAGSQQWAAHEGAYVVVPQSTVENPITNVSTDAAIHLLDGTYGTNHYVLTSGTNRCLNTPKATGASLIQGAPIKWIPFNSCGVMMTGLSNASTLRLRIKIYVETAPVSLLNASDSGLTVLATPSAAYDFNALKLYSETINLINAGVPVRMNGFGDFWKGVCNVMGKVALPALTAIGGAFGQPGLGAAAGAVGQNIWNAYAGIPDFCNDRPKKSGSRPVRFEETPTRIRTEKTFEAQLERPSSGSKPRADGKPPRRPRNGKARVRRPAILRS